VPARSSDDGLDLEVIVANPATMHVSQDKDTITSDIYYIAAQPERVFRALVDPQQVLQWWGQPGVYRCTEYIADLRPRGKWHSSGTGRDGRRFEVSGEFLQVDPPLLLVHSWIASWTADARTTVRWELEPRGDGTVLRLLHSGLAAYLGIGESYRGWPRVLGSILDLLERNQTAAARNLC
jgi:uncharacterized protein YndB with AHSA1/START domain